MCQAEVGWRSRQRLRGAGREPADTAAGSHADQPGTRTLTRRHPDSSAITLILGTALIQGKEHRAVPQQDPRDKRNQGQGLFPLGCTLTTLGHLPPEGRNGLCLRYSCSLGCKSYISSLATGFAAQL